MDRRLKQRIAELDRQWIFWRFAFPEECHYHAPFQPILRNLGSQGKFRLLPCLRNDGADAIMVFHPGRKNANFRFEAAESVFYEEIAEESSPSPLLSPLHRIAGGYEAKFAPGELRIFRRSECPSAPVPQLRPKMFSPAWTLERMEEYPLWEIWT